MINSNIGSSLARWALIVFWAAGIGTLYAMNAADVDAAEILGALLLLVAAFVLTSPGNDPLPRRRAAAVTALALVAVIVIGTDVVLSHHGGRTLGWAVEYAGYLGALSAVRGRIILGSVTTGVSLVLLISCWRLADAEASVTLGAYVPGLAMLAVGIVWGALLPRARRTLAALHRDREREIEVEVDATALAANQDERVARIVDLVAPQLKRIAAGHDLDPDDLATIKALEGDIRDTLTAPKLDDPTVRDAIHRARVRGVDISVLDVRRELTSASSVSAAAARTIVRVLESVHSGRVALKLEDPRDGDRSSMGSLVVITDGRSSRHSIPVD